MPKSISQKIGGIVKLVIALAILAIQVYPFLYVIIGSFKTLDDIQKKLPFELPSALYLGNYFKVLFSSRVQTYFKNSINIMVVTLIILLALSSMAGFALSRINFKGRKFLLSYFLIA
jgi:raffinose/stachyose/melibiose transport system permease protein